MAVRRGTAEDGFRYCSTHPTRAEENRDPALRRMRLASIERSVVCVRSRHRAR